ncbi:hypothetical protein FKB34_03535 [Glycocaulis profundi]|nr:hypothetical protein FKB34_03535 [Glycocaulis profundi]
MKAALISGLTALCLLAPAASALDEHPFALAIGNTMVGTYETGEVVSVSFHADGTTSMVFPDGSPHTGHWMANERYFCLVNDAEDIDLADRIRCEENHTAGKALGESWTQTDSYGSTVEVVVNEGH